MTSNAFHERLLTETLGAFKGDATVPPAPQSGLSLVDDWLKAIDGAHGTQSISDKLRELRSVIGFKDPEPEAVRRVLMDLSDQASQLAQSRNTQAAWVEKLESISMALRNFSGQLG